MPVSSWAAYVALGGSIGATLIHTIAGTQAVQPALNQSTVPNHPQGLLALCFQYVSVVFAASSVVYALPLIFSRQAHLYHSAVVTCSTLYTSGALLALGASPIYGSWTEYAFQYVFLGLIGVSGLIAASKYKPSY